MLRSSKIARSCAPVILALVLALATFAPGTLVGAQEADSVSIDLAAVGDIGVTGTALLAADGDQTLLTLQLDDGEEGYEGHIFDSTCDDHQTASVFYTVEPVDADLSSESVLDVPFSEVTNGDYWIHIHKPGGERGTGVSCAQLIASLGVGGALPSSGVGYFDESGSQAILLLGVLAALGLFVAARRLRSERSFGA